MFSRHDEMDFLGTSVNGLNVLLLALEEPVCPLAFSLDAHPGNFQMDQRTCDIYLSFWERIAITMENATGGAITTQAIDPKVLQLFRAGVSRYIMQALIGSVPQIEGLVDTYNSIEADVWLRSRVRYSSPFYSYGFDECFLSRYAIVGAV